MAEPDSDEVLAQFNQLIEELLGGNLHRTTFRPWEIAILVDLARCKPSGSILREYRQASGARDRQRLPQRALDP